MVRKFSDTPGVSKKFNCKISSSTFWFENSRNMKTVISSPETTKSLMQGSLNKFSNKFSETVWIRNFKDILKEILEVHV